MKYYSTLNFIGGLAQHTVGFCVSFSYLDGFVGFLFILFKNFLKL